MSGGGASASCAVFFTSFVRGGQVITANYGGDASHSASSGSTLVLVALPGSSSGCLLAGHGRITAANGDRARFAMLVAATPTLGAERYRDKGPAYPLPGCARRPWTPLPAAWTPRGRAPWNRDDQRRRLPPVSNRHPAERRGGRPGQLSRPACQRLRLGGAADPSRPRGHRCPKLRCPSPSGSPWPKVARSGNCQPGAAARGLGERSGSLKDVPARAAEITSTNSFG